MAAPGPVARVAARLFGLEPKEAPAVVAGLLMFFLLFTGYFMLRPVRETMGIAGGVDSAIEIGVVDEKIDPAHTRSKLTQALAEAPHRRGRHKNIPL